MPAYSGNAPHGPAAPFTAPRRFGLHVSPLRIHPLAVSSLISMLVLLVAEDSASRMGWIDSAKFPPARDVLAEFVRLFASGEIWPPLTATLQTWVLSIGSALLAALLLAVLVKLNGYIEAGTRSIIEFIRPVPSTALIPLVILALGANFEGALFLTFFGTVWQVLPVFLGAIHATDPVALDVARCFGLSKRQILIYVRLPSMWPHVKTAIRIATSAALVLLVSMEYLASISGIGKEVAIAYAGSNNIRLYAFVLVASILGLLANLVLAAWAGSSAAGGGKD